MYARLYCCPLPLPLGFLRRWCTSRCRHATYRGLYMWRLELSLVPVGEGVRRGFIVDTAISIGADAVPIPDMGGFLDAALQAVADSVILAFMGGSPR